MGFYHYIEKIKIYILHKIFSFDQWHYKVNYYSNNYLKCVVQIADSLQVDNVCEIGSGLGNIIGRINAKHKVGIDSDEKVIKPAKILYPNVNFIKGDFDYLINNQNGYDLIICCNFIHNIPPNELASYFNKLNSKYIICDQIIPGTKNYKFSHDFSNDIFKNYMIRLVINQRDQNFRNILILEQNG
jgi:trans-aconitate methyltransferase